MGYWKSIHVYLSLKQNTIIEECFELTTSLRENYEMYLANNDCIKCPIIIARIPLFSRVNWAAHYTLNAPKMVVALDVPKKFYFDDILMKNHMYGFCQISQATRDTTSD